MKSNEIPSMEMESILSELKEINEDPSYRDKSLIRYGKLSDEQQIAVFERLFKREYEQNIARTGHKIPLSNIAKSVHDFSFGPKFKPAPVVKAYLDKIFQGEGNG